MSGAPRRVEAALAPLLAEPRISSEQLSQVLRGHPVTPLEVQGDWIRVRGEDGYDGWLHGGYLLPPDDLTGVAAPCAQSLGCVVQAGANDGVVPALAERAVDRRRSRRSSKAAAGELNLPFGAYLFAGERVIRGEHVSLTDKKARFPTDARALVKSAAPWFSGAPYLWGGITPWGCDCSGFVQSIFSLHGVVLPRDSAAQAQSGVESSSTPEASLAGELLFFSDRGDRRITHVGIALGGAWMAHVSLGRGGFFVERFGFEQSVDADEYVSGLAGRFCFARAFPILASTG